MTQDIKKALERQALRADIAYELADRIRTLGEEVGKILRQHAYYNLTVSLTTEEDMKAIKKLMDGALAALNKSDASLSEIQTLLHEITGRDPEGEKS